MQTRLRTAERIDKAGAKVTNRKLHRPQNVDKKSAACARGKCYNCFKLECPCKCHQRNGK